MLVPSCRCWADVLENIKIPILSPTRQKINLCIKVHLQNLSAHCIYIQHIYVSFWTFKNNCISQSWINLYFIEYFPDISLETHNSNSLESWRVAKQSENCGVRTRMGARQTSHWTYWGHSWCKTHLWPFFLLFVSWYVFTIIKPDWKIFNSSYTTILTRPSPSTQ